MSKLLNQIAHDLGEIKADVRHLRTESRENAKHIEVLNHEHVDMVNWRKSIDHKLKIAAVLGAAGSFVYSINAAINLFENVRHWVGW